MLSVESQQDWQQAHRYCVHGPSRAESLACLVARKPAWDDVPTSPRSDMAAELYSLLSDFGLAAFTWRDWAPGRSGADPHREWREFLYRLKWFRVPHVYEETFDGGEVQFSEATWVWQAIEGGLVCAACGELFRPTSAQARSRGVVRCHAC